jgi:amphi-Trp domain-containing protein
MMRRAAASDKHVKVGFLHSLVKWQADQLAIGGTQMTTKPERDVEKEYSKADFVAKLRRLADAIESGSQFEIQITGERIYVPVCAIYNIEHERSDGEEEVEFQIKWERK